MPWTGCPAATGRAVWAACPARWSPTRVDGFTSSVGMAKGSMRHLVFPPHLLHAFVVVMTTIVDLVDVLSNPQPVANLYEPLDWSLL